ncbi:hypothetical protein L2E82_01163 [Cichorium intybus]|uniref:Uncharacterized protein n=1 Tax=Cichorium intybus TaxID=13427 RepID=A0ACB9GY36_CICIN|nr:hypothetical protein L2E82_01163 [Cichorium intybus]
MGFGSLLNMKLDVIPSKLGYNLVDIFDDEKLLFKTSEGVIKISIDLIYDLLRIPKGDVNLEDLEEHPDAHPVIQKFQKQFKDFKKLIKKDVAEKIMSTGDHGILFKLNFIVLFTNSLCKSQKSGICLTKVVNKLVGKVDISKVNWCNFLAYIQTVTSADDGSNKTNLKKVPAINFWNKDEMKRKKIYEPVKVKKVREGKLEEEEIPSTKKHKLEPTVEVKKGKEDNLEEQEIPTKKRKLEPTIEVYMYIHINMHTLLY